MVNAVSNSVVPKTVIVGNLYGAGIMRCVEKHTTQG
jgi:acetyl-CoA carboxylase carboxyltransferase component